jgi:hypothetical protein
MKVFLWTNRAVHKDFRMLRSEFDQLTVNACIGQKGKKHTISLKTYHMAMFPQKKDFENTTDGAGELARATFALPSIYED